jgi:hypothetical protein
MPLAEIAVRHCAGRTDSDQSVTDPRGELEVPFGTTHLAQRRVSQVWPVYCSILLIEIKALNVTGAT